MALCFVLTDSFDPHRNNGMFPSGIAYSRPLGIGLGHRASLLRPALIEPRHGLDSPMQGVGYLKCFIILVILPVRLVDVRDLPCPFYKLS